VFLAHGAPARAEVYRVSAKSTAAHPDGLTWATAFKTVQAGLADTILGDEVWAATGTYRERFTLKSGVALYGGFAGTESERGQRDFSTHTTTLDGGGAGAVVTIPAGAADSTRLDGFTIQHGTTGIFCSGASPILTNNTVTLNTPASGIQLVNSSALVTNNTLSDNVATAASGNRPLVSGAGICVQGGAPVIEDCTFLRNNAYSTGDFVAGSGAGIFGYGGANVTIRSCTFTANVANLRGGGISCEDSTASVQDCSFLNNTSKFEGAAIWTRDVTLTVLDSAFHGNSASRCSGVSSNAGAAFLSGNTIANNAGEGAGFHQSDGSVRFTHNWVTGNPGGGIYLENATSQVDNNLLADNSDHALRMNGGTATVWNNTISGNANDGGVNLDTAAGATLINNIIAFNAAGITKDAVSVLTARFNDVAGNTNYDYSGVPDQTGLNHNIRVNPNFADAVNGDYRLTAASECLDAGENGSVPAGTEDLDGKPRIFGPAVDLGAYELGTVLPATLADVADALKIAGGLEVLTSDDTVRLNVDRGVPSADAVDMFDITWLARHAAGLEAD
jgi:parallel beta-helix repeat protein/predicted outer membrane repeat protein